MRHKLKIGVKSKHWIKFSSSQYLKVHEEERWMFPRKDKISRRIPYVTNYSYLESLGLVGKSVDFGVEKMKIYYFDSEDSKAKFILRFC